MSPVGADPRKARARRRRTTTPGAGGRLARATGSIRFGARSSTHVPTRSGGPSITKASTSPSATTGRSAAPPGAHASRLRGRGRARVPRDARGVRGFARIGHFGYGHIDTLVLTGQTVTPGQHIGWTCEGDWHVHLSEFVFTSDGTRLVVNPLRPGGKLQPYVDRAAPLSGSSLLRSRDARLGTATENERRPPPASRAASDRDALFGRVDVRVRVSDPQSFIGWFEELPQLAAPHHPFRIAVTIMHVATRRTVRRREVFRAEQLLGLAAGRHYAPGTEQNLPASGCMHLTLRSLRRRVLVPPLSAQVLGHDAPARRALQAPSPRVGRRRERVAAPKSWCGSRTACSRHTSATRPSHDRAGQLQPPIALRSVAPRPVTRSRRPGGRSALSSSKNRADWVRWSDDDLVGVAPPHLQRHARARDLLDPVHGTAEEVALAGSCSACRRPRCGRAPAALVPRAMRANCR